MKLNTINGYFIKVKRIFNKMRSQSFLRLLYRRTVLELRRKLAYQKWIAKNCLTEKHIADANQQVQEFQLLPKFSVIMPVYNIDAEWLEKAIESVLNQLYPHWELCIADDASSKSHISSILTRYSQLDSRIKVIFRKNNGHISAASNSALELATGDYIALLDHDDELSIDALFENAKLVNNHPNADFIYSDEDKLNLKGERFGAFFKPDWSPDYLHTCMYTCHLSVYRTSLIRKIGGFRSEFDGSQDYDLALRVADETKNIYHIAKILYHWRAIPMSAASSSEAKPWAYIAGKKALEEMIARSRYPGRVEYTQNSGIYRVHRDIIGQPLVSIIIPSTGIVSKFNRGSHQLEKTISYLENCLCSIRKSSYKNLEIVVVDSYNISEVTLERIKNFNIKLIRCSQAHNLSRLINEGVLQANGKFIVMLNARTEVMSSNWIELMLEFAQQKEIGAVGAKLLSGNGNIQHVGVILLSKNPCNSFHHFDASHPGYHLSNKVNKNYLAITGACLMMRKKVFEKLGGMDENLPINHNNVDLCLQAHKAGYRNVVTPFAQLKYYEPERVSRDKDVKSEEKLKFEKKWSSYLEHLGGDPYYNVNFSQNSPNFELF
jgi:O-antigen biosynthesis protein